MHPSWSVLTVSPREPGFEQYTRDLHEAARNLPRSGNSPDILDPIYFDPLTDNRQVEELAAKITDKSPTLVHIHHEFGFMGSKVPGRYLFPRLVKKLRSLDPALKVTATAHTVLSKEYSYPWRNRGLQSVFRLTANQLILPFLRRLWIQGTWGPLDGVIVHSSLQLATIRDSGCPVFREIPHYVPQEERGTGHVPANLRPIPSGVPVLLVFGYFTPEKAQDIAIRAMAELKSPAHLILAGGVRRDQDQGYFASCERLVRDLNLTERVQITGFVTFEELDALVKMASLVLLPFRETSGSGSLADLMSRRSAILASDLPLNREIEKRAPGALRFFKSEDPLDCARRIEELLSRPGSIQELKKGAQSYAETHAPTRMAERHLEFYRNVLND